MRRRGNGGEGRGPINSDTFEDFENFEHFSKLRTRRLAGAVLESPAACTQVLRLARTGRIAGGANTSMDAARVRRRPALAPACAERVPACHRAEPTRPSRNSDAFEDRAFEDFENFEHFPKLRTIFKTRAFKTVEKFQNFEAPKPSSATTCRNGVVLAPWFGAVLPVNSNAGSFRQPRGHA